MSTVDAPRAATRVSHAWDVLLTVADPEIPMLSICDLGIVRGVHESEGGTLAIVLTPTYSGCPATEWIERSVIEALGAAGLSPVQIMLQRAPAWSSDWISTNGLRKLRECGIVPPPRIGPGEAVPIRMHRSRSQALVCPRCASADTERISAFGATACKALWRCRACGEPFEFFKPI